MRILLLLLIFITSLQYCFSQDAIIDGKTGDSLVIAFGSCNKQYKEQPLWGSIIAENPSLFLFLGDNIYGDTEDMTELSKKYAIQRANKGYLSILDNMPVIGVWDDHDYGKNDAGKEYLYKKESQQLFLDFFGIPETDARREREGVYSSTVVKWKKKNIKIILLDTRYHRDALKRPNHVYEENQKGTILGHQQWSWLTSEMADSSVDLYIIASGIQMIAEEHDYEKWANFPNERKRLFNLIEKQQPKAVLLLSGDRHIGEISVHRSKELAYPLVDVTSSGLTHVWSGASKEPNRYREGEIVNQLNYGVLSIIRKNNKLAVTASIKGEKGEVYESIELNF